MTWRMAWRNLWRHRTRTLIMTSAVAFSYALFLVSMGMGDNGHAQMLEAAAEGAGGDVLVHADGYWDNRSSDLVIRNAQTVLNAVESAAGVEVAIPRVLVNGLVSSAAGNRPVMLQGIVPEREIALQDYAEDLEAGEFLTESTRDDPLILGATIVEKLKLELGDRVVLTASDPEGEVTRALFHLTGIVETGLPETDEGLALTTLDAAQTAVAMDGMLTQIGVIVADGATPDSVAAAIHAAADVQGNGLEVMTWREAIPEMVAFIEIDDAFLYIYIVVIFAVVAFAIANTFLMAVMERVREFGLLNALGLRGGGVARLLLAETVLMTLLALAVGFTLGYSGHLAMDHWGIPVGGWGVEDMEISGANFADLVMRSTVNPGKWIMATLAVALITIGSALYPAYKASSLAPSEAMRFYE
ncbi:MAG: ABC transporter permease [Gemmatimonadota bacterium]|jgi:putative ABC transport system permease protein